MTTQLSPENLSVITHVNTPVITTELLAQLYGTDRQRITNNFNRNKERFTEEKHYYKLTNEELRDFKRENSLRVPVNSRAIILWTHRGAARHAKMLETDQAWDVFEKLEDCYFSQREKAIEETPRRIRQSTAKQLIPLRQTAERLIATGMGNIYPDIWKLVHQRFDVDHIHQLPPDQIGEAIEYLDTLEGEYIGKQKQPVALPISYPMTYFDQFRPMIGERELSAPWRYPHKMLSDNGDYPNPLGNLLQNLKNHGYDVQAARFQFAAMLHYLEIFSQKISMVERAIR